MPHQSPSPPSRKRTSVQQRDVSPAEKRRSHRSPEREKRSHRSPIREKRSYKSPEREKRPYKSPEREKRPYKSPEREKRPYKSPEREKGSSRARSPRHVRAASIPSRSPSPRTKRLRRAQAEQGDKEVDDKKLRRVGSRESEKVKHREKGSDKEDPRERDDRKDNGGRDSRRRHDRSASPKDRHRRDRNDSRSPSNATKNGSHDEVANKRGAEHSQDDDSANMKAAAEALEAKKDKPSFELSGKLAEETNRVKGITLLFNEPPDARKPDVRWRLYVFKGGDVLNEPLYIHRQTCYLFGRERRVADIPTDHPSCSKQHAVIQFRQVEKEQADGMLKKHIRPYIMDLGSTNGTFINENRIEPQRYYELIEKDTIKFGNSSREYVILHENSAE